MSIVLAIAIVSVIGLVGAAILVVAAKYMTVEEDPRVGQVTEALPGANCGACGYAGCADYAKAIVSGEAQVGRCVPGGQKSADAVAAIMGVEAGTAVKMKAVVLCQGSYEHTTDKYDYQGVKSCAASAALYGGSSACPYGCLGYGDCVKACKFDAIHVENGLSRVDPDKCTGCGECAKACPKHIISVRPVSANPIVLCANEDRGALTHKECTAGCIGCMKCTKVCPEEAITVKDNRARIDPAKCISCGACVLTCPVGAIVSFG